MKKIFFLLTVFVSLLVTTNQVKMVLSMKSKHLEL